MAKETGAENVIPEGYRWSDLKVKDVMEIKRFYDRLLWELGDICTSQIQEIYQGAKSFIAEPAILKEIIVIIDELDWCFAKESLGKLYDALLEKSACNGRYGIEQNYTSRVLIDIMTELVAPQLGEKCNDPACGTFGFMIAADRYVKEHTNGWQELSEEQILFQQKEAFSGGELVFETRRLAIMNATLHDVEGKIYLCDTLSNQGKVMNDFDVVLTNPEFCSKKETYATRDDFKFQTSYQSLNYLQHIYNSLKTTGTARAAVIVPDNVLFSDGEGAKIRIDLMNKCNLHTILRLPIGVVFPRGVKANILFFTRGTTDIGNTNEVWFYDLRTNMPFLSGINPLESKYFDDFITAYTASERRSIQDERWNVFSREELEDSLDKGLVCESLVVRNFGNVCTNVNEILLYYLNEIIDKEKLTDSNLATMGIVSRPTLTKIRQSVRDLKRIRKGAKVDMSIQKREKNAILRIIVYSYMPYEDAKRALELAGYSFDENSPQESAIVTWLCRDEHKKDIGKLNNLIEEYGEMKGWSKEDISDKQFSFIIKGKEEKIK